MESSEVEKVIVKQELQEFDAVSYISVKLKELNSGGWRWLLSYKSRHKPWWRKHNPLTYLRCHRYAHLGQHP